MSLNEVPYAGADSEARNKAFGAVRFHVDRERRLIVVCFGRKITAESIASYAEKLRANPGFRPTFSEIADLREVEELELEADDFIRLADQVDPFSEQAKRAFVVRTAAQNHAARMHKILHPQRQFGIFDSIEDAERWICR